MRPCAILFLALSAAFTAAAQPHRDAPPVKTDGGASLTTQLVKTGLYLISGGGGNSLVRLSGSGSILVDGKLPGSYAALRAQVRRISEQPIRILINTGPGEDHTGTNGEFAAAGVPILAQKALEFDPTAALPTITYDRDYTLSFGGVEARVFHVGGRTAGRSIVYFPNLKAIATGDLFTAAPATAGDGLADLGAALDEVLKLDFDIAVPGKGPTLTRGDLEKLRTRVVARAR